MSEMIPHDEDGLTIREIATGNTYEAENIKGCQSVGMQGIRFNRENPAETIQEIKKLLEIHD